MQRSELELLAKKALYQGPDGVIVVSPDTYRAIQNFNEPMPRELVKFASGVEVVIDYSKTGEYATTKKMKVR